jgi:hypothetical protein
MEQLEQVFRELQTRLGSHHYIIYDRDGGPCQGHQTMFFEIVHGEEWLSHRCLSSVAIQKEIASIFADMEDENTNTICFAGNSGLTVADICANYTQKDVMFYYTGLQASNAFDGQTFKSLELTVVYKLHSVMCQQVDYLRGLLSPKYVLTRLGNTEVPSVQGKDLPEGTQFSVTTFRILPTTSVRPNDMSFKISNMRQLRLEMTNIFSQPFVVPGTTVHTYPKSIEDINDIRPGIALPRQVGLYYSEYVASQSFCINRGFAPLPAYVIYRCSDKASAVMRVLEKRLAPRFKVEMKELAKTTGKVETAEFMIVRV